MQRFAGRGEAGLYTAFALHRSLDDCQRALERTTNAMVETAEVPNNVARVETAAAPLPLTYVQTGARLK